MLGHFVIKRISDANSILHNIYSKINNSEELLIIPSFSACEITISTVTRDQINFFK